VQTWVTPKFATVTILLSHNSIVSTSNLPSVFTYELETFRDVMTSVSVASFKSLKLKSLQHLAQKCGLPTSGTKPILASSIYNDIERFRSGSPFASFQKQNRTASEDGKNELRVCSIDMGLRNLAYSTLSFPLQLLSSETTTPRLSSWRRISVLGPTSPLPTTKTAEKFNPEFAAKQAYTFLTNTVLKQRPDIVLIERQRFRSRGGSTVLEWTLRVNVFEAMLWSCLNTFSHEGLWTGIGGRKGLVEAVDPGRVSRFWNIDEGKKGKIEVVGNLLHDEKIHLEGHELEGMKSAFLEKVNGKRSRVGKHKVMGEQGMSILEETIADTKIEMKKIDDLADCLLQGWTWYQWQLNRRTLSQDGIEAFVLV
jgi:cruciform cutting endonuclease 1